MNPTRSRLWLPTRESSIDVQSIVSLEEIVRFAYTRTGSREDAEDVALEVFATAYKMQGRLSRMEQPRLYIFGIARKKVANAIQARKRNSPRNAASAHDDLNDQMQTRQVVANALDALPDIQREAIVLKYVHGFTQREIAEILGKSTEAVNSLLQRARETFGEHASELISQGEPR